MDTLYRIEARICRGEVNALEDSSIKLWHKRLGHISKKGLELLAKKQLRSDLKGTDLTSCTHCLVGKQHRHVFHRLHLHRCQSIFDLVHTDVSFINAKSLGGATYFVTFIDDHSRKI